MNYVLSPKGSYVPVGNIKLIVANKGGSLVRLKTGEAFKDPRSPETIFLTLTSTPGPLAESIYADLAEVKENIRLFAEVAKTDRADLTTVMSKIQDTTNLVNKSATELGKASTKVAKVTSTVRSISKELNDAIQEAISG